MIATPSQTIGPFFAVDLRDVPCPEGPVRLEGRVLDGAGDGVPDALVEIWSPPSGFGRCLTGAGGGYRFALRETPRAELLVFARGLLKPVRTCVFFGEALYPELQALVPERDGGVHRLDIRLQGVRQTPFLAL